MPRIHVCSLSRLPQIVAESGAGHLVTIINKGTPVTRPNVIREERHLYIGVSDIVAEQEGHILPAEAHVGALLGFVEDWDRRHQRDTPLLIHCWAGVSRSTAAAFIGACALDPRRDEQEIAAAIRRDSPTATPNARLVAVADAMLGRKGRMSAAIASIGRGADCFEGVPFALALD
jgi:predicted protein tyrosine phosphatase